MPVFLAEKLPIFRPFLDALSSSRSVVVLRSVCWLVILVKKWPLEYKKVIKTYLPTYLWDSSDSGDICDSCDSSDGSDGSDSSDKNVVAKILWLTILWLKLCD